jgi:probable HAF family extracellular repeat protein
MNAARLMTISPLKVVLLVVVVALSIGAQPVVGQPVEARQFSMTDLGTLPGGTESFAYGINDRGQVVGSSQTASGENHAFLWDKGVMRDLGTLGGTSFPFDINNRRQVVGSSQTASEEELLHAFLWDKGEMTDLGTLPGGIQSVAFSINGSGQVVGHSWTASGEIHAVLWSK